MGFRKIIAAKACNFNFLAYMWVFALQTILVMPFNHPARHEGEG